MTTILVACNAQKIYADRQGTGYGRDCVDLKKI